MELLKTTGKNIGNVRIEQGEALVFQHYPNGTMWAGAGPRTEEVLVKFNKKFVDDPMVTASLSGFDARVNDNVRIRVDVPLGKITDENFVINVTTAGSSGLDYVTVVWQAIGKRRRNPKPTASTAISST